MGDRNKKTRSSLRSLELAEELVEQEILPRLPVKSLLRFRCVSKSWRSLIGSKRFIEKHLQNSTNSRTHDNWSVIFNCFRHGLSQCSMRSYLDEERVNPSPINDLTDCLVVGCCNSLVCIANEIEPSFFLWNPSTRISFRLPEIDLDFQITRYGFGWDEKSNAYKVLVGVLYVDDLEALGKVYSSKTDSWKTVEHGSMDWHCSTGKFACGRIHWLTEDGYIETFDLASEVFGMIELPCNKPENGGAWIRVSEIEGCLSVVCDSVDENEKRRVWVMKEYGVNESWVEEILKPDNKMRRCCEAFFYPHSLVSPLPQKNLE